MYPVWQMHGLSALTQFKPSCDGWSQSSRELLNREWPPPAPPPPSGPAADLRSRAAHQFLKVSSWHAHAKRAALLVHQERLKRPSRMRGRSLSPAPRMTGFRAFSKCLYDEEDQTPLGDSGDVGRFAVIQRKARRRKGYDV